MSRLHRSPAGLLAGLLAIAFAALAGIALAACSGGAPAAPPAPSGSPAAPDAPAAATSAAAAAPDFPTGPAVTVAVGYEPPTDRVDSTGAHLPANGRPTLVFVDAIW